MHVILRLSGLLVAICIVVKAQRVQGLARTLRNITKAGLPFHKNDPTQTRHHVLVLGDSTMYGAAIEQRDNTTGGLLAQKYPDSSIETWAANGARVKDLRRQLGHARAAVYDVVVIGIGGNDVMMFSRFKTIRKELEEFLSVLQPRAHQIILSHCVNLGNTGFFLPPLSQLFDYRTKKLSRLFNAVSQQFPNIEYVNFYRSKDNDFYVPETRDTSIATDGLHPTDYGNRQFFKLLESKIK